MRPVNFVNWDLPSGFSFLYLATKDKLSIDNTIDTLCDTNYVLSGICGLKSIGLWAKRVYQTSLTSLVEIEKNQSLKRF